MHLTDQTYILNLSGNKLKNYRRKKKILSLLYYESGISATAISKKINVSVPTSLALLKELEDRSLVKRCGIGDSKGGRRPALFDLGEDSIYVISCELGRYKCKIGIFNEHNKLVAPLVKFSATIDDDNLVDKIEEEVTRLVTDNNINSERIQGIGLAMPGLIDETKGINYTIKKVEYRNIAERLKEKFGGVVYVNNDARMQAYGEFIFGAAKGGQNALIVNWNWGIGLGIIINGELYNGATGFAGEFSHIKAVEDGDLCICGKRGCLETVSSVYVLIRKAKDAVKSGMISQLTKKFRGREEEITIDDIINAAKSGDECSINLLNEVSKEVGRALANVIQLLNPDIIVIGGVVSLADKYILVPIQQSIDTHCLEQISGNVKLEISQNWERSGLLGITATLFQKLFSNISN